MIKFFDISIILILLAKGKNKQCTKKIIYCPNTKGEFDYVLSNR